MNEVGCSARIMANGLNKMKCDKSLGVEVTANWGDDVLDWLARLFNVCMVQGKVPDDR